MAGDPIRWPFQRQPEARWLAVGLHFAAASLILVGLRSPMLLVAPLWIYVWLLHKRIHRLISPLPVAAAFVLLGVVFGLAVEGFALLENLEHPPEERALQHPEVAADLLMGLVFYLVVMCTWLPLVYSVDFSIGSVLTVSGVLGLFTNQNGAVLLDMFVNPVRGGLVAAAIFMVYATFPTLAYALTKQRFPPDRRRASWVWVVLAQVFLFASWALYGLVIHPPLRAFLASGPAATGSPLI